MVDRGLRGGMLWQFVVTVVGPSASGGVWYVGDFSCLLQVLQWAVATVDAMWHLEVLLVWVPPSEVLQHVIPPSEVI